MIEIVTFTAKEKSAVMKKKERFEKGPIQNSHYDKWMHLSRKDHKCAI